MMRNASKEDERKDMEERPEWNERERSARCARMSSMLSRTRIEHDSSSPFAAPLRAPRSHTPDIFSSICISWTRQMAHLHGILLVGICR